MAVPGAHRLEAAGLSLWLLPGRAVWWPAAGTLFVADLHFGKAATFRRAGLAVPEGTTADNLARLTHLLGSTGAHQLVFLGDLLHARSGRGDALWRALGDWRGAHAAVRMVLVRGNHDRHAGDPPAALGVAMVEEPWAPLPSAPLLGCHHPHRVAGNLVLAGHLHPTVNVWGGARDSLRLPCFVHTDGQLLLPAFGAFTGSAPTRWPQDAQCFAIADERVLEVPSARRGV